MRAVISAGSPRGPHSAHQDCRSTLGMPPSAVVGMSGAAALRCAEVIATPFTRPPRTGGSVASIGSKISPIVPPIMSASAGDVPR